MGEAAVGQAAVVVAGITCRYDSIPALDGVSLQVQQGEFAGVVGPNGSGKTTLLRVIHSLIAPQRGVVLLRGADVAGLTPRQVASMVAVVPQQPQHVFGFTVWDIVMMGRFPHIPLFAAESMDDAAAVRKAMERTRTWHLRARQADGLSGGERQRVLLARALAQDPEVLLLDEPTAHLDIRYQLEMMELVAGLHREGMTVIAALHDLNLASMFSRLLVLLHEGQIVAMGTPGEVLTPERLGDVYGTEVEVRTHPVTGRPVVTVLGGVGYAGEK